MTVDGLVIVPTGTEAFEKENLDSLGSHLEEVWLRLGRKGVDIEQIIRQGMISPATCCLINPDKTQTVEKAFSAVKSLSRRLKSRYAVD